MSSSLWIVSPALSTSAIKDVQRAAAEAQRRPVVEQHALRGDQAETVRRRRFLHPPGNRPSDGLANSYRLLENFRDGNSDLPRACLQLCLDAPKELQRRSLHNFTTINATSGLGRSKLRPSTNRGATMRTNTYAEPAL